MARAIDFIYGGDGDLGRDFVSDAFVQNSLCEKFFKALARGYQWRGFARRIFGEHAIVVFAGQVFDAIFAVDAEYFYQRERAFLVGGVADFGPAFNAQ